ncbi:preprotein translocase subunit SecE [Microlunatus elymi]|uniref:Protein translocase subunit SecE n=1 Tax=Microlunatus elymi TaxID=2596828 RepID=A0A516Q5F4_9ACTN|nr:preprotein translocase subunit SecE [Microlunatus elymi]
MVGVGARKRRSGGEDSASGSATKTGGRKKDHATPKQKSAADKPKRTTPASFVRGSISELKKVVYPTGNQLANYFVVVLVFVLIVIGIVTGLDYGFGWLMLKIFG